MVACELQGTRLLLQLKRVSSRMTSWPCGHSVSGRVPPNIGGEPGAVIGAASFVSGTIKLTLPVLTSAIAMSPTVDRDVRHQHDDTTEKEDGAPQKRRYGAGFRQQTGQRHDAQNADR